jgi:hypothetical protein
MTPIRPSRRKITAALDPEVDGALDLLWREWPRECTVLIASLLALEELDLRLSRENAAIAVVMMCATATIPGLDEALTRSYDLRQGLAPAELAGRARRILDALDIESTICRRATGSKPT